MAEAHKLTEAQAKALCAVEAGDAYRYVPMNIRKPAAWSGVNKVVAQRLLAEKLVRLLPCGFGELWQSLALTEEGRAALASHKGETP